MRTELVLNQMEAVVGGALLGHIHSKLPKKSTAAQGQGISTGGATGTWDACTGGATGTWDTCTGGATGTWDTCTGGATGTWDTCTGGATGTWDPGMESTQSEGFQVRV